MCNDDAVSWFSRCILERKVDLSKLWMALDVCSLLGLLFVGCIRLPMPAETRR